MKRDYADHDGGLADPNYFVGLEVEHTIAHGVKTLFVVGVQPLREILTRANALGCKAIYFGANMSFAAEDKEELMEWVTMINGCLTHVDNFWCTLDFDVQYAERIAGTILVDHPAFIPMISVKIPHIMQMGYNSTVKIDDNDFESTNPGVWCHKLHDLMDSSKYTNWKQYKADTIV